MERESSDLSRSRVLLRVHPAPPPPTVISTAVERSPTAPLHAFNFHSRHLERSRKIFFLPNFTSNNGSSRTVSFIECGLSRPHGNQDLLLPKGPGPKTRPGLHLLVSLCQFYNQQNNSFQGDCPRQSPLHSNKLCRLSEVVEPDNV